MPRCGRAGRGSDTGVDGFRGLGGSWAGRRSGRGTANGSSGAPERATNPKVERSRRSGRCALAPVGGTIRLWAAFPRSADQAQQPSLGLVARSGAPGRVQVVITWAAHLELSGHFGQPGHVGQSGYVGHVRRDWWCRWVARCVLRRPPTGVIEITGYCVFLVSSLELGAGHGGSVGVTRRWLCAGSGW